MAVPSMPAPGRPRLLTTSTGTRPEAFGPAEWVLVVVTGLIWGSSFLFIAEGLDAFRPGIVAFARLTLGTLTLVVVPRARRQGIDRHDWPRVALVGILWMAIPMILIPYAQQWVNSAVAGMVIGAMPIAAAVVTAVLLTRLPSLQAAVGIAIGFCGVVAIAWPNTTGDDSRLLGVTLLVLAVICYGVAVNLAVPLQQRYGSLPVILRAQLVSLAVVFPFALAHVPGSTWDATSALAMVPLGVFGSGVAFLTFTTLVGRAGADRGSVAVYLLPVVAVVLGVTLRGDSVAGVAVLGSALVILGAWLTGRAPERQVEVPAVAGR